MNEPEAEPLPAHRELVRAATRGDAVSVDSLLARYLPGVLAFVRLRARGRLLAKDSSMDVVQSACREVLVDLADHPPETESHFRHWLYLAAERKLVDRARYHGRAKRDVRREVQAITPRSSTEATWLGAAYGSLTTPSQNAMAREELDRIEAAFAELPDDYQQVILLTRFVGLSHEEVAMRMGRSAGATRVLLHRALARLARRLGPGLS